MSLLFAIGILLLGAAAALLARAIALSRVRIAAQVRQIEAYGFNATEEGDRPLTAFAQARLRLDALAERVGRSVQGSGWRAPVTTQQLRGAGLYTVSPDVFQGYRVMLTVALPALVLLDSLLV